MVAIPQVRCTLMRCWTSLELRSLTCFKSMRQSIFILVVLKSTCATHHQMLFLTDFWHIPMYADDGCMGVRDQLGLIMRSLVVAKQEHTGLTLKTARILSGSNFGQGERNGVSQVWHARKDKEVIAGCKTFFRIYATALQSGV